MTTLRKLRFPILIGAGLIAAAGLVYISTTRVNSDKTQGAIGKRDVYRDGQTTADVERAGNAPVAIKAVLETGEFKALAKDPAFQELLKDRAFNELAANQMLWRVMTDPAFLELYRFSAFADLAQSTHFQAALAAGQDLKAQDLQIQELRANLRFESFVKTDAFQSLMHNIALQQLMHNQQFMNMFASGMFARMMRNDLFNRLASQQSFQAALMSGNAAGLLHYARMD